MGLEFNFLKKLFGIKDISAASNDGILRYPLNLTDSPERQVTSFTCYVKHPRENEKPGPRTTYLPTPAGIAFTDGGEYGTVNLGIIGGLARQTGNTLLNNTAGLSRIVDIANKAKQSFTSQNVESILNDVLPFSEALRLRSGTVTNPNTNTTFSGNTLRNFTFTFKMMATSEQEAYAVKNIQSRFRYFTYASSTAKNNLFTLNYPPIWTIRFLDIINGGATENVHLPRIYSCYLQSVSTTFNGSQNMYFEKGAPLEVELTLQFQESKVLTREDIDFMEHDQSGTRRVDPQSGRPVEEVTSEYIPSGPGADYGTVLKEPLGIIEPVANGTQNQGDLVPSASNKNSYYDGGIV